MGTKICLSFLLCLIHTINGLTIPEVDYKEDHEVEIEEHGFTYKQRVIYDETTGVMTIIVPQHLDIDASTTIIHEPSNVEALLNHDKKYCHVSETWPVNSLAEESEASKILELEQMSLSDENAEFVGREVHINHEVSNDEFNKLPKEIRTLCKGFQTFNVSYVKTTRSKDEFLNDEFFTFHQNVTKEITSSETRIKRQTNIWSSCQAQNQIDKCTYMRDFGRTCRWLICRKVEEANRLGDCARALREVRENGGQRYGSVGAAHITSETMRCAMCCQNAEDAMNCKCDSIYDKKSFSKCQLKNDCFLRLTHWKKCNTNWPNAFSSSEYKCNSYLQNCN